MWFLFYGQNARIFKSNVKNKGGEKKKNKGGEKCLKQVREGKKEELKQKGLVESSVWGLEKDHKVEWLRSRVGQER